MQQVAEDWAVGLGLPETNHMTPRWLRNSCGLWCSHLQHEDNGCQILSAHLEGTVTYYNLLKLKSPRIITLLKNLSDFATRGD